MKRCLSTLLCCGGLMLAVSGVVARETPANPAIGSIPAERYLDHVRYLSSDELQGRGNGSPDLERAAEYIARQFDAAGLEPAGTGGTFFQPFDLVAGFRVGPGNRFVVGSGASAAALTLGRDYIPLSAGIGRGAAAPSALPLVFAGYGLTSPDAGYDDYARVDVRGAAVLVFGDAPRGIVGLGDDAATTEWKATLARARGARLLIVVDDFSHQIDPGAYEAFARDAHLDDLALPVVHARRDALQRAIGARLDLERTFAQIEQQRRPRSQRLKTTVTLVEDLTPRTRRVRNVVGVVRGTGRADEAIVVGAHYDHLGLGGRYSLAPRAGGQIHNGADDNASGTAALIEIAHAAAGGLRPSRSIVFVAFAGEELGLLGSSYYVEHPVIALNQTVAMLNLDMVGRPRGRILVSGLDTGDGLSEVLANAAAGSFLEAVPSSDAPGKGATDDSSFLARRVPSINFFSGYHGDYHRPSDDWQRIDAAGGAEVARIALAVMRSLAATPPAPSP